MNLNPLCSQGFDLLCFSGQGVRRRKNAYFVKIVLVLKNGSGDMLADQPCRAYDQDTFSRGCHFQALIIAASMTTQGSVNLHHNCNVQSALSARGEEGTHRTGRFPSVWHIRQHHSHKFSAGAIGSRVSCMKQAIRQHFPLPAHHTQQHTQKWPRPAYHSYGQCYGKQPKHLHRQYDA